MQVNQYPAQSYTTRNNNTIYWGGATATSDDGSRKAGFGAVAVDKGSDGSIDAGLVFAAGRGPNGAFAAAAGAGPNHSGAAGVATNGELTRTWSRYQ